MPPNANASTRPNLADRRLWSNISIASKRSQFSFATSAFEADDERSSSDASMSSDDDDGRLAALDAAVPHYGGHDTRPTSPKEIKGWYMYAFAAETYVICGIGSFIPILLESLARENGVLMSDPTVPCGSSDSKNKDDGQCVVYVLGMPINTASFAMYTFSVSVLAQALLVVSISCAADHGSYRKKMLLAFAWIGSFSVMSFIFINKSVYLLGAIITIISNTSFGASFVLLNSFLPLLVRNHPTLLAAKAPTTNGFGGPALDPRPRQESVESLANSTSALLPDEAANGNGLEPGPTHAEITSKELKLSTSISSTGIGIGYIAALFVQCVAIGIIIAMKNTTWSQRVALFVVGCWWAIFTIPAALWLRPRPGPPLTINGRTEGISWISYFLYSWKSLLKTVRVARRLLDIMLFLAGWFLLSDAIATTSSTAILFAKTQLHMKPWALGMINVISTASGVFGAFGWSWISNFFGLKPHQTILVCIGLFELIPVYGLMGYLPFVQRWGVLGLQQPWEMYPLAAVYGLVLGGLGAYCRSLYGELIPPGFEAAFYALYAITDKGSSVFGPAIVGRIIDKTGSIRPAFWFLGAIVALPAPLIYMINVERGKLDGGKVAEALEGVVADTHQEEGDDEERHAMLRHDEEQDSEETARG
ncbi:Major facilitator superfamily transporter [Cordyceps fumosorosea ARSEF 2679]|uniref:Autophagy-related protein n=1 Tax=Cordyceps fumosorosea (strain ARSEF 2679) TaxID=1081104 RepID=A0A162J7P8_CORFA|nr:Major facilitator superfamily transporter [Cordyceps fumosorosea ARSEF 2679]OAA64972.1 Major facilitator superfamily transporter [Cordyceps fumosorosea ARSEF 2679]